MKQKNVSNKAYWLKLWELFRQFLEFGLFTFGGGMSIVAQIQKTYVEEKHLLKNEDILDLTSVGRSLPGTMIGNVAVMFGYHMAGAAGSIACLLSMILPPLVILGIITYFYTVFQQNPYIMSAMAGVRAAVVPIIICAITRMMKGAFRYAPCYLVAALTFTLYFFFEVNCAYLVLIGIVAGIVICEICERKEAAK